MNHHCFGTYYADTKKYRCLLNGIFYDSEVPPERCQICGRPVQYKTEPVTVRRTVIVEQAFWNGQWVNVNERYLVEDKENYQTISLSYTPDDRAICEQRKKQRALFDGRL